MGGGVTAMVVFSLLASAANYASSIVFSRVLSPSSFGELSALIALVVIVSTPTQAAQTVVAERVAFHRAKSGREVVRYFVRHAIAHVFVIATVAAAVYVLAIPLVIRVLDLQHPGPAIALAPVIFFAFFQPVAFGVLQGLERFTAFGIFYLSIGLSRIAFGVPWAWAGGGAGGALAGQALGMAVVLLGTGFLLRRLILQRGSGAARKGLKRTLDMRSIAAGSAFVAFAVISNLDVLLAKIFLSPAESGVYAAISAVGKVITFLPAAVAVVMVPNAARALYSEGSGARVLRVAALLVGIIALAAAIPAAIAPDFVINLMFGHKYAAAAPGVLPIVFAGAGFAMMNLLLTYAIAIRDRRWMFLLIIGVVLQVAGIATYHDSPAQVATVQAVVAGVVLLANEYWFHSIVRRPRAS